MSTCAPAARYLTTPSDDAGGPTSPASVNARLLLWGVEEHALAARQEAAPGGFDVVLATEVLYGAWRDNLDGMLKSVRALLSPSPDAQFVVCTCMSRVNGIDEAGALTAMR